MVRLIRLGLADVKTHVYGLAMSERLTTSDWIRHGLKTLATRGPAALKAGPLAQALGVSRGSFYWHFADLADFRAQLLAGWQARGTDQVIADLEDAAVGPERLKTLLRRAMSVKDPLERAVRAWAAEDPDVAAAVAAVDARRIAYIEDLLVAAGVGKRAARVRTTFLYWAYLGQPAVMDRDHASLDPQALDEIAALFEG